MGAIKGKRAHTIIIDEAIDWPADHPRCRCVIEPVEDDMSKRLFPEEKTCYDVARKVMKEGPTRHVVNIQGEGRPWSRGHGDSHAEQLYRIAPIIYIRDDGWTLATPKQWVEQANSLWRDQWVGIIEIKHISEASPDLRSHRPPQIGDRFIGELSVIPENGPAYRAGYIDENGEPFDIATLPQEHQERIMKVSVTRFATIEQMREWMRAGCPIE